jgi:hypothetical protein
MSEQTEQTLTMKDVLAILELQNEKQPKPC